MELSRVCVVAICATYRRPAEMRRLAESLKRLTVPLHAWIVVDNARSLDLEEISALSGTPVVGITPEENLGCGGGLAAGERMAMERFRETLTHVWIMDDDVAMTPESLGILLEAMAEKKAAASTPMIVNEAGYISWPPGILDRGRRHAFKQRLTPGEYRAKWGTEPERFSWAQGIALLVTRTALEAYGFHRTDYWVRGEDLEFTLRITEKEPGIFVPLAEVAHLPPPVAPSSSPLGEYQKHLAMLRNIAYTTARMSHGRRLLVHTPANMYHFFRAWGWRPRQMIDALQALYIGAVRGKPAGV